MTRVRLSPALLELWATWNAKNATSRAEYAPLPSTTGRNVDAPCIRRCGRLARTHRGVCRRCQSKGDT